MLRRLFIVLWAALAAVVIAPTAAVSAYIRWTAGWDIEVMALAALLVWLPTLLLALVQYVLLGFANPLRLLDRG